MKLRIIIVGMKSTKKKKDKQEKGDIQERLS